MPAVVSCLKRSCLAIVGIIFIIISVFLILHNYKLKSFAIDYTDFCKSEKEDKTCFSILEEMPASVCKCKFQFNLPYTIKSPVYIYYGLSNYFQNHRSYVKSYDPKQLYGLDVTASNIRKDCKPYDSKLNTPYSPCGKIANSLFNDTFELYQIKSNKSNWKIPWSKRGIAWKTDRYRLYRNPRLGLKNNATKRLHPPPNWRKSLDSLDLDDEENNGYQNEELIVWMKTASRPDFHKLHRRIQPNLTLEAGEYELKINYSYPVKLFHGRKTFILTNVGLFGAENPILGFVFGLSGFLSLVANFLLFCVNKFNYY